MLILATDMARHSEIVERFKSKLDTFDFHNDDYVSSVSRQMSNSYCLQYSWDKEKKLSIRQESGFTEKTKNGVQISLNY